MQPYFGGDFLDAALISAAGLEGCHFRRFSNSYTNAVYLVEERFLVLRVIRNHAKWETDRAVTQLLGEHGLPVPTIVSAGQVGDQQFTLQTCLPGVNLENVLHDAPAATFYEAGRLLARLHQISFPAYGRYGLAGLCETYTGWAEMVEQRLERFLIHPGTLLHLTAEERDACRRFLHRRRGSLQGGTPCLLHRDYRPGNLLVDPESYAITGLLDFDSAQIGTPGFDFAKVESEFYGQRSDARQHFDAGYTSLRPLPDPAEVAVYDLINSVGGIGYAHEYGNPAFLARNIARTHDLLNRDR